MIPRRGFFVKTSVIVSSALVILLSLPGFNSGVGAAPAADQGIQAPASQSEEQQLPIYTPPNKTTPRARVGGGMRGTDGKEPEIVALVPDHVGLTVKQAPSLNWFLSKPTSLPIRFTLIDIRSVKPIYEGPIPTPGQAGVHSLNLKDLGLTLEPDVQYRWYISAIRNPDSPSQDIVAGGVIERCEFSTCLVEMEVDLSCDQQSVRRNAVRGFWYDAMSCLCDLITANQKDASLRRMRAALLKQVGLNGVAEWDLKSAPPEK
ncbi:MAG TPA: DUF928 domain-containing protein [Nitrospiraceae bacterium]|nr:DUF928 domain-containing protein [Nitrospiraceae bacterium]